MVLSRQQRDFKEKPACTDLGVCVDAEWASLQEWCSSLKEFRAHFLSPAASVYFYEGICSFVTQARLPSLL